MPITDHNIQRHGAQILLGIALENAVLDIVTDEQQLRDCMHLLTEPPRGLVSTKIGSFGDFEVTLNLHHDETVSIFVDGPQFESPKNQSVGLYLDKQELLSLLTQVKGD